MIEYVTGKSECVEDKKYEPMDKADWIVRMNKKTCNMAG